MIELSLLTGEKLLILGGNPETGILVKKANALGVYTIVIDPNPIASAKNHARKHYEIDGFDIDRLIQVARAEKVDGVLVGVADILVPSYLQLCEALDLPCYASREIIDALTSKDGFLNTINTYSIKGIPSYSLDERMHPENLEEIKFPVMVKPVDNGGGVGMTVCYDKEELISGVKFAINNSKKGLFLVEKYMSSDDIFAYYTFKDGEIYLSAIADRITTKKGGKASPVCIAELYPSKYTDQYINFIHPSITEMFRGLGIRNGVLNIQFFVEGGNFYAYDPGFRLQGAAPDIYANAINGFDHRKMLINFALTGSMGVEDLPERNDYKFRGKRACTLWILLKSGIIKNIYGLKELRDDPSVIYILKRFNEGDEVLENMIGTERQVMARIYIVSDSKQQLVQKINQIKSQLSVLDSNGEEMVLDFVDTNLILSN